MSADWSKVKEAVTGAKSIAFDGCHKIYVLMDDAQTKEMISYGYRENVPGGSWLYTSSEMTPNVMLSTLRAWWEESCGLRFINAVRTVKGDPNEGFTSLIGQFDDEEEYA